MKNFHLLLICITVLNSCFKKEKAETRIVVENDSISTQTIVEQDSVNTSVVNSLDTLGIAAESKMDYATAKNINTPEAWKQFLVDNPDFKNKKDIEEQIIILEANQIINDRNTGEMPVSEKIDGSNRASSTITVENDTSCELTLRYIGNEVKKVVISPNSKQNVNLKSGNYQVTASACGYNYAGREHLSGKYEAVYYIRSVRY